MDPRKLKDVAATLNAFMVKEGYLSELSVKTIWDRLMSCITQGNDDDIGLAFPIRVELQNMIKKTLPTKLAAFKNHVQDLDDEMNKVLPSPNMSLTMEDETTTESDEKETSAQRSVKNQSECKQTETKDTDAIKLRDELDDKENRIQKLQEKIQGLEAKIGASEGIKKPTSEKYVETESNETDHDKTIEALQKQLTEKDDELKRFKADIEHLQHRLSTFSSVAIRVGNETVVDLSDPNRPVRLGERYSELYDNDWTDGFEVLTKGLQQNDTNAIRTLIEILYDSYDFCDMSAKKHIRQITKRVIYPSEHIVPSEEDPELDVVSSKALCDLRLLTGKYSFAQIQKMFMKHIVEVKSDVYTKDLVSKLTPFILKCVELCWFMVIQTPPLYINTQWKSVPGEQFNNDLFKFYTDTGDKLDYVVWPPLYLKEDGAVLCKGVAQPKGILY